MKEKGGVAVWMEYFELCLKKMQCNNERGQFLYQNNQVYEI